MKFQPSSVALLSALVGTVSAIYPEDHWNRVHELTPENFESTLESEIEAGRTMFAPSWNAITKAFEGNPDVSFGDINLSQSSIRGEPHNPGAGGWPTIRYFNHHTGIDGGSYTKRTQDSMCTELGDKDYLADYIETFGDTWLCSAEDGTNCDRRESAYAEFMLDHGEERQRDQLDRLESMDEGSMNEDLALWLFRRKRILRQLLDESTHEHEEL